MSDLEKALNPPLPTQSERFGRNDPCPLQNNARGIGGITLLALRPRDLKILRKYHEVQAMLWRKRSMTVPVAVGGEVLLRTFTAKQRVSITGWTRPRPDSAAATLGFRKAVMRRPPILQSDKSWPRCRHLLIVPE